MVWPSADTPTWGGLHTKACARAPALLGKWHVKPISVITYTYETQVASKTSNCLNEEKEQRKEEKAKGWNSKGMEEKVKQVRK